MMDWFASLSFHRRGEHHCMWPNTDIFQELANELGMHAAMSCISLCPSHPSMHAHAHDSEGERSRQREKLGFWCDVQIGDR
jgi:hypothetical protein